MKKILYIITQSDFGGAQRYVFDLATNLSDEFEIAVAAGKDGDNELFNNLRKSDFRKIKTIYLKHLKRAINPWRDLLTFFEIRSLIKKERPDIIHLNSTKAGIIGSLASRFAIWNNKQKSALKHTCLIIYTAHGWVFNEPMNYFKKKLYLWLEKSTAKYKNKIICVSEYDYQIALKNNFPAEKLITIHNGIDFNNLRFLSKDEAKEILFSKIHNSKFVIHNSIIIGTIANLYPTKGIEHFIEAALILRKSDFRGKSDFPIFFVIGDGKERPKLETLIKKYHLENNFFLLGHISNASQHLKSFDIFVLPSVKEGLPYAILEAMSAKIPVIASGVGGIPEIIENNKTGLIVQPRNPKELAEKLIFLAKNQEISRGLSEKGQIIIQNDFSIQKMIADIKKIYAL